MTHSFTSLLKTREPLETFYSEWKALSVARGGDPDGFDSTITLKKGLIDAGQIVGEVVWVRDTPVGVYWVERMTPTYGSILVYSKLESANQLLVQRLVESKVAVGIMAELLHFEEDDRFLELVRAAGLMEIPRQRMVCYLNRNDQYPSLPQATSIRMLSKMTALEVAQLSVEAHRVSGDYTGYRDMESVDSRMKLEYLVHDGYYGRVISPCTVGLFKDNQLISIITNIVVPCWNQPEVPWVFDISTGAASMGHGYGEFLLQYSKALLGDFQFPMWGLAVSKINVGAIKVYERNGFEPVDSFSEFLQLR